MSTKDDALAKAKKDWGYAKKMADFDDIEQEDGNLKQWSSAHIRATYNPVRDSAKEEYYRLATHFYNEHKFSSPKEKEIWYMHSEGISIRDIAKKMDTPKYKATRTTVHTIIQRLAKEMITKCQPSTKTP